MTEQTVVEGQTSEATPTEETQNAPEPSFDELLNEFPAHQEPQPEQSDPKLSALESRVLQMEYEKEIPDIVSKVRGELDSDMFDTEFVETWLDKKARSNPKLSQAYIQRKTNPQAFNSLLTGPLRKEFSEFAKKFQKEPDDRDAVVSAVKNASTRTPVESAIDYGRMSNAEFERHKADLRRASKR